MEEERKGNRRFRIVHNEQQSENMKVGKYEVELRIETVTFRREEKGGITTWNVDLFGERKEERELRG